MKQEPFEPVTDVEVLSEAMDLMAIGNVAVLVPKHTTVLWEYPNIIQSVVMWFQIGILMT